MEKNLIISKRVDIQNKIKTLEKKLSEAKQDLKFLQMQCPHPNKQSHRWNDDSVDVTIFWCNDCGDSWES